MTPQEISHEQALKELQETHHRVDYDIAAGMVAEFRTFVGKLSANERPDIPECLTFNKTAILEILNKPGCIALRMYPAIKEKKGKKSFTLVLVGVDDKGENIVVKPVAAAAKSVAKTATAETASLTGGTGSGTYDETQTCPPYPKPINNF